MTAAADTGVIQLFRWHHIKQNRGCEVTCKVLIVNLTLKQRVKQPFTADICGFLPHRDSLKLDKPEARYRWSPVA